MHSFLSLPKTKSFIRVLYEIFKMWAHIPSITALYNLYLPLYVCSKLVLLAVVTYEPFHCMLCLCFTVLKLLGSCCCFVLIAGRKSTAVGWLIVICCFYIQGSYRSGKTGKSLGICVARERSGKNIIFEKSGKMIFDHADCRFLWFFCLKIVKSRQICGSIDCTNVF